MTIQAIDPKKAVESLKKGERIAPERVRFNGEMVEALDAMLLTKNGITVPEDLIFYDDDAIDYSDDPAWTKEELSNARRVNANLQAEIWVAHEMADWLAKNNINLDKLLTSLINDFYKNLKATSDTHL